MTDDRFEPAVSFELAGEWTPRRRDCTPAMGDIGNRKVDSIVVYLNVDPLPQASMSRLAFFG